MGLWVWVGLVECAHVNESPRVDYNRGFGRFWLWVRRGRGESTGDRGQERGR